VKAIESAALEVVAEALKVHDSLLDEDMVQKSMLILEVMQEIKGYDDVAKGVSGATFSRNFLDSLERVNKFYRTRSGMENSDSINSWISSRVQSHADSVCKGLATGEFYSYDGQGEIGISLG
jgi:hypothetical protein